MKMVDDEIKRWAAKSKSVLLLNVILEQDHGIRGLPSL